MWRENLDPIERKCIRVIPVSDKERPEILIIIITGRTVDDDRAIDAVGIYK